jgi:hypothetical protein
LHDRLIRRGLAPSVGLPAAMPVSAPVPVPAALAEPTVRAALVFKLGREATAGAVSAAVASLTKGALRDMTMTRSKVLALRLLMISAAGGIGAIVLQGLGPPDAQRIGDTRAVAQAVSKSDRSTETPLPGPVPVKPGGRLLIEVLEALPGRPISGEHWVRYDGTVSLGFYGDLKVAGLTRHQIKVALINHMRKFLTDETLGLTEVDEEGKVIKIDPADSTRVLVDDTFSSMPRAQAKPDLEEVNRKLDLLLLSSQGRGESQVRPGARPGSDLERRLSDVERTLDRIRRALEDPDRQPRKD